MRFHLPACLALLASTVVVAGWGCSSSTSGSGFAPNSSSGGGSSGGSSGGNSSSSSSGASGDDGGSYGGFGDAGKGPPPPEAGVGCTNLQCNIQACDGGKPTTISGKVMDPAGHNPLYNVVVLIPNTMGGALPLIPEGINSLSCSCGALFNGEEPVVDTLTAPDGTFTLTNVPSGKNVPVVVQIGKWRKEIVVPDVQPCQDNPAGNITMPKNAGDGMYVSMPNIAVSTGFADTLECLLTRIGIDEKEFSGDPNTPTAHVHIFQGSGGNTTANPAAPSSPASLWDSTADLKRYDIVMLSCEGSPTAGVAAAQQQNIADYVSAGGRVFGEHYHYQFFANAPAFPNTANWTPGGNYMGAITGQVQTTLLNGKAFPEGQALETWLTNVGALSSNLLPIGVARNDATVVATNVSTPWVVTGPGVSPAGTQYFSWDMPFNPPVSDAGVPEYCGRVVFSDLHVSGGLGMGQDYAGGNTTVPSGCASTQNLQPDEDALEFIFYDLSSCVTPIGYPPKPPPPQPEGGTAQ
jgi:hypothetical protein